MWLDPSSALHRTETGGKISGLTDRSGNANHATSAGGATDMPIGSIGSLTCMAPVGSNRLILPNFSSITAEAEIFIVVQPASLSENNGLWLLSTGGATYLPFSDGKMYDSFAHSSYVASAAGTGTLTTSSPNIYNVSRVGGGGADGWVARVNGSQIASGSPAGNCTFHTFGWLGQNWSALGFSGKIGEVLFYSRVLGASGRSSVIGYLRNKWGTL